MGSTIAAFLLISVVLMGWIQNKPLQSLLPDFMVLIGIVFGVVTAVVTALGQWVTEPEIEAQVPSGQLRGRQIIGALGNGFALATGTATLLAWSQPALAIMMKFALGGFLSGTLLFPIVCRMFVDERKQSWPWDRLQLEELPNLQSPG
jgi:hypothetical protein